MIFLLENKQKTHANQQLQKVFAAVSVTELGKSLLMKQESRQKLFSGTLVESWSSGQLSEMFMNLLGSLHYI